ncbi:MAG: hypothetical protein M1274_15505 [Actinobacteria bacterium]|nr:hypothetical protein [Actinomycetota bacterium]
MRGRLDDSGVEDARVALVELLRITERLTEVLAKVQSPISLAKCNEMSTEAATPSKLWTGIKDMVTFAVSLGVFAGYIWGAGLFLKHVGGWPGVSVFIGALIGPVMVILLLALTAEKRNTPQGHFWNWGYGDAGKRLEALTDLLQGLRQWTAESALGLLAGTAEPTNVLDQAVDKGREARLAATEAFWLATVRNVLEAHHLVRRGRRRLVPMKSTVLALRRIERQVDDIRSDGSIDTWAVDDVEIVWSDSAAIAEDGRENHEDYKYVLGISVAGLMLTLVTALVTFLLTSGS